MKFKHLFDADNLQEILYHSNLVGSLTALIRRQLNLADTCNDRIQKFWRVRGHKNPAELSIKDRRILEKLTNEICAAEKQISLLLVSRSKAVAEYLEPSKESAETKEATTSSKPVNN
jgi:hypothetical protein